MTDDEWREQCAKRARWQRGNEIVSTAKADAERPTTWANGAASSPPIPERDILADCIKALKVHPRVAWAHRLNSGVFKGMNGQPVRAGFKGCPDIMGMLTDGRALFIEVKRQGKLPTPEQIEFLGLVTRNNGVGFVAWSAADVARGIDGWGEAA